MSGPATITVIVDLLILLHTNRFDAKTVSLTVVFSPVFAACLFRRLA